MNQCHSFWNSDRSKPNESSMVKTRRSRSSPSTRMPSSLLASLRLCGSTATSTSVFIWCFCRSRSADWWKCWAVAPATVAHSERPRRRGWAATAAGARIRGGGAALCTGGRTGSASQCALRNGGGSKCAARRFDMAAPLYQAGPPVGYTRCRCPPALRVHELR